MHQIQDKNAGYGVKHMNELTVDETVDNIEKVTAFVNEKLEGFDCPIKEKMQIDIAIDELFGNIAHYAYNPDIGPATVCVEVIDKPLSVLITFIDNGLPYDPLAKADPDVSLSAKDRQIGGLGIYMVKKSMDEVSYEYKNGRNILTIKKNI
jgi:anti-sigma regulatory factor (Ser/Thr protein kinase)